MLHEPSKAKSTYAKLHEPKTLFTRDSYYQYLEGQLNKMALFMAQSTKDAERISRAEELLMKHQDKLLKTESTMKSLLIYSHEAVSHGLRSSPGEERMHDIERKLSRIEDTLLNLQGRGASTNRRQQESQQSCETDARYEHLEREVSKLKRNMAEGGSHNRSSSKISAESSVTRMNKQRRQQLENPMFGGSHLQSQKTEKLVDRQPDIQLAVIQRKTMEDIAFSTCTQIVRDELQDVVLRPQLKHLEQKMKEYFAGKFEAISSIITKAEAALEGHPGHIQSIEGKKPKILRQTTRVGDTTQSSLKRKTDDREAGKSNKREKTVDPFPSFDEGEHQRMSFTLKGALESRDLGQKHSQMKVQFSERNMKKKKSLKKKDPKFNDEGKTGKKSRTKDRSKSKSKKSRSRSASRSVSKSQSKSAFKSIQSLSVNDKKSRSRDRVSNLSSLSRNNSRSLSKSQSRSKKLKPRSNKLPEDMTNRHRYPSHRPPSRKELSKKLSIHTHKQTDQKKKLH